VASAEHSVARTHKQHTARDRGPGRSHRPALRGHPIHRFKLPVGVEFPYRPPVAGIADYVAAVKRRSRKVPGVALRQLLRIVREYPREPLLAAVREAARYGLYDLDRLERMILRRVAREYFLLDDGKGPYDD
jgi:hypothetical protein